MWSIEQESLTFPVLVPYTCSPVVCQLESSGKWPDEVEAIRGLKTAFYVHLSKALQEQAGVLASPTPLFLDVLKVRTSHDSHWTCI